MQSRTLPRRLRLETLEDRTVPTGFEDVGAGLAAGSHFNGPDPDGTTGTGPFGDEVVFGEFQSGGLRFNNEYSIDFGSWSGWAYSNETDTTTPGFGNQFSAAAGSGAGGSGTYGVSFVDVFGGYPPPTIRRTAGTEGLAFASLWVTNTTYAHLSMRDGDAFAKKFGGTTGDDPDWFLLTITGRDAVGTAIGTVDFYLADYRFANNALDYIVDDWTEVDVSSLASAARLEFMVSGSDVGPFGLNTPTYFALDDVELLDVTPPTLVSIDDGDANDTVVENTTLTYTLAFSEPLAPGSLTAADLDNAGTAAITIGDITETSPGTYTVAVTPTTPGTVILRLPGGATVADVAGNPLAVPLQDDTTVTATANNPPTVSNPIPDQSFTGPGTKTFQFAADTFADADGMETVTYTASLAGGGPLPAWLAFDPVTRTFSGNPAAADVTPLLIRVSAADGNGGSVFDEFQLTLSDVNDPPVAAGDDITATEDGMANGILSAVDADGPAPTFAVATGPTNGAITFLDPVTGEFTYTPFENYFGPDSFTFTATDGLATSAPATVAITVDPVNDAPVAGGGTLTTDEDTAADGTVTASDIDNGTLTLAVATGPSHGTLTAFDPLTGAFTYTPDADYAGPDSFTFTASDGSLTSNAATVAISVGSFNDAPVLSGDAALPDIPQDTSDAGATVADLFAGLASDADAGDALAGIAVVANPQDGDQGAWQYSTDGGATWQAVGAVSEAAALVLDATTRLRFLPEPWFFGPPTPLTVRGVDTTYAGGFGVTADVTANGGGTAFSAAAAAIGVDVVLGNVPGAWLSGSGKVFVAGMPGNDKLAVALKVKATQLQVKLGKVVLGTFAVADVTGRLVIRGFAGDDRIAVAAKVVNGSDLFGGEGNDRLTGSNAADRLFGEAGDDVLKGRKGDNLLLGGAGNDVLVGSVGRDVAYGGFGSDKLKGGGGPGEDLLVAGPAFYDASFTDLAVFAEIVSVWTGTDAYADRVAALSATRVNDAQLGDDGDADTLVGGKGLDWYVSSAGDKLPKPESGETSTSVD